MRILRRPGGVLEYKTNKIRLRLQPTQAPQQPLLIVHQLNTNGYIKKKMTIKVDRQKEMAEVATFFQIWAQTVSS